MPTKSKAPPPKPRPKPKPKPDEPIVSPSHPLPPNYTFVPAGNAFITKHSRLQTHQARQKLYVVRSSSSSSTNNPTNRTLGILVPTPIHAAVQSLELSTRSRRAAAVQARDALLSRRTRAELLRLFPRTPGDEVAKILARMLAKRSGRVGRAGDLALSESVRLGVSAHVRHRWTGYEGLLRGGMEREEARREVGRVMERVLGEWSGKGMERKGGRGVGGGGTRGLSTRIQRRRKARKEAGRVTKKKRAAGATRRLGGLTERSDGCVDVGQPRRRQSVRLERNVDVIHTNESH